ncbi:MAG: hypothetical protein ACFCUT_11150 [Kiloniellaceae bacterium]
MAKTNNGIDEKALSKGELRKLNALRKSIGDKLGDEAFAKWYAEEGRGQEAGDPNIDIIEKALNPHIKKIRIPRGGAYAIRRGRGRFIVEPIDITD